MKLHCIARARIPTEKAHGLQIMKMCEAFAKEGADVELIVPFRIQSKAMKNRDPFKYYGVDEAFKIKRLPVPDLIYLTGFLPGKLSIALYHVHDLIFSILALLYCLFRKPEIVFTRNRKSAYLMSYFFPLIFESHAYPTSKIDLYFERKGFNRFKHVITITENLKEAYTKHGFNPGNIHVLSDGVDLEMFDIPLSRVDARTQLGLEEGGDIILYTGHLYPWKGMHTLLEASKFVKGKIVIVGGLEEDVKAMKEKVKKEKQGNVQIVGHVNPNLMPIYLKAADVLVLPNSASEMRSKFYTSPLKLFEYMASKRPIVASDLPSIREVLNEGNAILVEPDSPVALAEGIEKALKDEDRSKKMSEKAFIDVSEYTWERRAKKVIACVG